MHIGFLQALRYSRAALKRFGITATVMGLTLVSASSLAQREPKVIVEPLLWVDEGFLTRKRQVVDDLGRREFGARLQNDKRDLSLLNRIIQKELINQTQRKQQQALGVVLGDVLVSELGLEWKVYRDALGKSRAVCIPDTEHCVFPVTMISKRMGHGRKPDATELFETAKGHLAPFMPKLPYTKKL